MTSLHRVRQYRPELWPEDQLSHRSLNTLAPSRFQLMQIRDVPFERVPEAESRAHAHRLGLRPQACPSTQLSPITVTSARGVEVSQEVPTSYLIPTGHATAPSSRRKANEAPVTMSHAQVLWRDKRCDKQSLFSAAPSLAQEARPDGLRNNQKMQRELK